MLLGPKYFRSGRESYKASSSPLAHSPATKEISPVSSNHSTAQVAVLGRQAEIPMEVSHIFSNKFSSDGFAMAPSMTDTVSSQTSIGLFLADSYELIESWVCGFWCEGWG